MCRHLGGVPGSYRACTWVLHEENFSGNYRGVVCGCHPENSAISREGKNTPRLLWRSPSRVQSMDLPPTLTKLLGWTPWRTLGLLPVKFRGLQGRPKHCRAACERSRRATRHGPAPNIHNALRVATPEESGATAWDFICLQRKPKYSWSCLGGVSGSYQAWTCLQR